MIRAMLLLALLLLSACSKQEPLTEAAFVGKWHSSKANAAIRLDANNEWELLGGDGGVTEFGVWQVYDNKLVWSFRADGATHHDINPVVSFATNEFKLREASGAVTTFVRVN